MSAPVIRIPTPRRPVGTAEQAPRRVRPEGDVRHLDLTHRPGVPAPRPGTPRAAEQGPAAQQPTTRDPRVQRPGTDTRRRAAHPEPPFPTGGRSGGERRTEQRAAEQRPAEQLRPTAQRPTAQRPAGLRPAAPEQRSPAPGPPANRDRIPAREAAGRGGTAARVFTIVARLGSLTTLAAMVVLAAAVAGLADGDPPTGPAAEVSGSTLR
ncbi:hypothetical protein [Pseudonocardia sp. NPDC046786]|uniref:hypothetical protein n=1 Tax=Pseudonocardia sp. NPDC046786 TaxID=3155471 RepID=UPI0033C0EF21